MKSLCELKMLMVSCSSTKSAMEMVKAIRRGGMNMSMREVRGGGGEVYHCCRFGNVPDMTVGGPEVDRSIATRGLLSAMMLPKVVIYELFFNELREGRGGTVSGHLRRDGYMNRRSCSWGVFSTPFTRGGAGQCEMRHKKHSRRIL